MLTTTEEIITVIGITAGVILEIGGAVGDIDFGVVFHYQPLR